MMDRMIRYQKAVRFGLGVLIAAACMLACHAAVYGWLYRHLTPQTVDSSQWIGALVLAAMLVLGLAHLALLNALWQDARSGGSPGILRSLAFALGVVSLIMLAGDAAALSDIGKQTLAGLDSRGEWMILLCDNILRGVFLLSAAAVLIRARRRILDGIAGEDARDVEFITVHEVGFVSAILAVGSIALAFAFPVLDRYRDELVWFFTAISIAPWALMLFIWFVTRPRRGKSWWDEKQVTDMGRAALLTLPFAGIVMLAVFIVNVLAPGEPMQALWFPAFVIAAVFGFSGLSAAFSRWR